MDKLVLAFVMLVGSPLLGGCSFSLHLHGAELVNPLDPDRLDPVHNSQELAIRIYQLKDHEKIKKVLRIPWDAFVSGDIPEAVHPFLVVPADTKPDLRPQEDFYIQRRKRQHIRLELQKGTRWLLVVPRGGRAGERSTVALHRVRFFDTDASFCFDRYDVFQRTSRIWPCPKTSEEE